MGAGDGVVGAAFFGASLGADEDFGFAIGATGFDGVAAGLAAACVFGISTRGVSFRGCSAGAGSCEAVRQVVFRLSFGAGVVGSLTLGAAGIGVVVDGEETGAAAASALSGGTSSGPLHLGQRIFFPAAASGRRNFPSQLGQAASTGMGGRAFQQFCR